MSVTLTIEYGNGAQKIFAELPFKVTTLPPQPNGAVHVHDALHHAAAVAPGLDFSIEEQWLGGNEGSTNRAGLVPLAITEIDGVGGPWQVTINAQPVTLQKQMTGLGIFPEDAGALADGDRITVAVHKS
ncbi:MAG: hypothetical protein GY791_11590 [Alphaproteobacteria bacterium]|nr:hypothetical protein [Alphaproteobacteria bacterium]